MNCTCDNPGACPRHATHPLATIRTKSETMWRKCRTRPDFFCLWEQQCGRECDMEMAKAEGRSAKHEVPWSCEYRGDKSGLEECPTCKGSVKIIKYECELHGICQIQNYIKGVRACSLCADRKPLIKLNADSHGYGDAMVAAWIAEGSKAGKTKLIHYSQGDKANLLKLFGQEVSTDPKNVHDIESTQILQREYSDRGQTPRWKLRSELIGIRCEPKRPRYTLPAEAVAWASPHAGKVLLFPQTCHANREWPPAHWLALAGKLRDGGIPFLVVIGGDDRRYEHLAECTKETAGNWGRVVALMAVARVVVGNDSAPVNIAGTVGTKTIALLGPTTESCFVHAPEIECLQATKAEMPCVGCWFKEGYNFKCDLVGCLALANITPDRVYERIRAKIE